ncbi:MAG: GNAT family N-acetyltransferase [Chitinophagaceae bacterium]|jgi:N-acetyltransferase
MVEQLDFTKTYILEDNCVLLQPLTQDNCKELLHFAVDEPDIWKFSLVAMNGEANFKKYITQALQSKIEKTAYPFIVFDKRTQAYAGSTRFYDIQLANKTLQLGYTWYGKKFQGTGLNKHCKYLLLQFAFEHLQMERVEFRADNNNVRSIAAMKSIGCTVEGVLRSNMPIYPNGRRDSIILSILKNEWEQSVKEKLYHQLQK